MEPVMTSATSATSTRKLRRAFTLIELLVVIGIILVLAGFLVPMVMKSYRTGERKRVEADLTTITVAIQAFKDDFGDIPRPDNGGTNTGFASLGRYLIGPYGVGTTSMALGSGSFDPGDCYYTGSAPNVLTFVCIDHATSPAPGPKWVNFGAFDNKEGPGIKKPIGGPPFGPYLQPEKFKTRGLSILDSRGNPILYFPASPVKPNIHQPGGYIGVENRGVNPPVVPLYNAADNEIFFRTATENASNQSQYAIQALQTIMGVNSSATPDGGIGAGETEVTTAPFVLWTAGADGVYGPVREDNKLPKTPIPASWDDVTNFR